MIHSPHGVRYRTKEVVAYAVNYLRAEVTMKGVAVCGIRHGRLGEEVDINRTNILRLALFRSM